MKNKYKIVFILLITFTTSLVISLNSLNNNAKFTCEVKNLSSTLSTGGYNYLFIKNDGALFEWGQNEATFIWDKQKPSYSYKEPFKIMDDITSVYGDQWMTLVIDSKGFLYGWGSNLWNRLEKSGEMFFNKPKKIMDNVSMTSIGDKRCIALKKDGSVWLWGNEISKPIEVMKDASFVTSGHDSDYVIKNDGSLWAWGDIGIPDKNGNTYRNEPTKIMEDCISVSSKVNTFVVKKDFSLWAWGYTKSGDSKHPIDYFNDGLPTKIMENVKYAAIGYGSYLAIKNDNSLWTWGENSSGQLGDGTNEYRISPAKIMNNVDYAVNGINYTLVTTNDGDLWLMGSYVLFDKEKMDKGAKQDYLPRKIMNNLKLNK